MGKRRALHANFSRREPRQALSWLLQQEQPRRTVVWTLVVVVRERAPNNIKYIDYKCTSGETELREDLSLLALRS